MNSFQFVNINNVSSESGNLLEISCILSKALLNLNSWTQVRRTIFRLTVLVQYHLTSSRASVSNRLSLHKNARPSRSQTNAPRLRWSWGCWKFPSVAHNSEAGSQVPRVWKLQPCLGFVFYFLEWTCGHGMGNWGRGDELREQQWHPVKDYARDTGSIPGSRRPPLGRHSNPLQFSCLENPMDRGVWWATAQRATKSQIQLKQLSTHAILRSLQIIKGLITSIL